MRRPFWLCFSLAVLLMGTLGCGTGGSGTGAGNPVGPVGSPLEVGNGPATVQFRFVTAEGQKPLAEILPQITSTVRVTFILRVLNEGNVDQPYVELRKEVPVTNNAATVTFPGLPIHSVVGEVRIASGTKDGSANWHGALDLATGTNTIDVAPVGSKATPDLLASVIDEMNASTTTIPYVKPYMTSLVNSALSATTSRVATSSDAILTSVREVYLAQNTASGSQNANPYVSSANNYIGSYWQYKDQTTVSSTNTGSIRQGIRPAVGYWDWSYDSITDGFNWWKEIIGETSASHYACYFTDKNQPYNVNARWRYIDSDPSINQFVTYSKLLYYDSWWGSEVITRNELYGYSFNPGFGSTDFTVNIIGLANGLVNENEVFRIRSEVWTDVRRAYPTSGSITVTRLADGTTATVVFNGTCVARVTVNYADSTQESFRLLLDAPPQPSS